MYLVVCSRAYNMLLSLVQSGDLSYESKNLSEICEDYFRTKLSLCIPKSLRCSSKCAINGTENDEEP